MGNRLAFHLGILIFFVKFCPAQQINGPSTINQYDLVGIWQANSSVVSSTLQANFQFLKSGKFIFNVNGYSDLNPIQNISGTYKIEQGRLYLKIDQYKELRNFNITESSPAFQFGSFVLEGGKIVAIKQNDSTYYEHDVKIISNKCVLIDNQKYFKLSSDPLKFYK